MDYPTEQPRVAIRAALQVAGILTETGDIRGAEADRPDARLLALIAQYHLTWETYVAIWRKGCKQPGEKDAAHEHYAAAERAAEQIAVIPATTIDGAHAKAQLAIDRTLSNVDAAAISALRDALLGPAPLVPPAAGKPRRSRQLPAAVAFTPPDDGPLLALIDEYRSVRQLARPEEPYGSRCDQTQQDMIRRYIALHDRLANTPALTGPGIRAKLLATLPSRETTRRWGSLLRSAMLDMLEVGP
jgi:hypothetical protein